jgi:hypothetical protein
MNLIDFLNSNELNGYNIDSNIEVLGDFIYEEEFDNIVEKNKKNLISFYLPKDKTLEDNEFSTILTILPLKGYSKDKLYVEIDYTNKEDDIKVLEIYERLNLLGSSLYLKPTSDFVKEDFLNILILLKTKLLADNNKIFIAPLIHFMQYYQQKLMVLNFINQTEENKDRIQKLLFPESPEDIKKILLSNTTEEKINEVKDLFFNSFTEEDNNTMIKNIGDVLFSIKEELLNNSELYGMKIVQEY